jgi:lysozyme
MMTPEGKQKLKTLLVRHEAYKQFPYVDITGHMTIGVGRNLSDRGISTNEAYYLLDDDIIYFSSKLSHFLDFFDGLDEARQIVLIDMCFNVGVQGLLGFQDMLSALEDGDYDTASEEMMKSKWALQVGERADCLADIMQKGYIDD